MITGISIFLAIYVIYAIFIACYMNRLFKRFSYLSKPEIRQSEEFPGFTRDDYKDWSKFHFTVGAIFLFPFRMLLTFFLMGFGLCILFICSFFCCTFSYSKKISKGFKVLSNTIIVIFVRVFMLINGLFWIEYTYVDPKPYNIEYFEHLGEVANASIICNHTTWEDIFFFLAQPKSVGFISNSSVKKIPVVGQVAQIIQCIFVDRKDPESKKKCLEDLRTRAKNIKSDIKSIISCF
jgi:hypothetical protein